MGQVNTTNNMAYNFQKAIEGGETEETIREYLRSQGREQEADTFFKSENEPVTIGGIYKLGEKPEEKGLGSRLKERGTRITEELNPTGKTALGAIRGGVHAAGEIAGGIQDVIGEGISKITPERTKRQGEELLQNLVRAYPAAFDAIGKGIASYEKWKTSNPELAEDLESVVNIGSLIPIGRGAQKGAQAVKEGAEEVSKSIATKQLAKEVTEEVAPIVAKTPSTLDRLKAGAKAVGEKVKGALGRTKEAATELADTELRTRGLPAPEAKVVKMGIDDGVLNRLKTSVPDDVKLGAEMLERQAKNLAGERGIPAAKEVVGDKILERARYIIDARKDIGGALGETVEKLPLDYQDVTPQIDEFSKLLREKGIQIGADGRLINTGIVVEGDMPIYQRMWDLVRPNKEGVTRFTPKRLDEIRKVIFREFDLAKARTQTFSDEALRVAEEFRRLLKQPLDTLSDGAYGMLSEAYAKLTTPLQEFLKLIGYKGDLDDVTDKALRVSEVAQRILGNAADRPQSVIDALEEVAKTYGFKSNNNIKDLVWLSDLIEEMLGSTQTRSFVGGIKRGATNAIENALGRVAESGNIVGAGVNLVRGLAEASRKEQIEAFKEFLKYLSNPK